MREAEPEVAPPVENPVPEQDVALVEDHVSVVLLPRTTVAEEAVSDVVGAGGIAENE